MRIEAENLQAAFEKAASELGCSVTQLDIKILQNPSSGFLGFFKKTAVIEAVREDVSAQQKHENKASKFEKKKEQKKLEEIKPKHEKNKSDKKPVYKENHAKHEFDADATFAESEPVEVKKTEVKPREDKNILDTSIIDVFNKNDFYDGEAVTREREERKSHKETKQKEQKFKADIDTVLPEVKENLNKLFAASDFKIDSVDVGKFNDDTILIELDGEDAALLIGKEGYRYKAVSYMLYNWINSKYNLAVRLEIAEFLKNQEAGMDQYLQSVIERIQDSGRGKTKSLDGVLVKIALEKLRSKFPDKYVGIKSGNDGQFVVVNDFIKK